MKNVYEKTEQAVRASFVEKMQGLQVKGVLLDDLEDTIDSCIRIGFFRMSQIAVRIHEEEPKRQVTTATLVAIFHYEQELRMQLTDCISYFEIQLRTMLSSHFDLWYGGHGYKNEKHFEDKSTHRILMSKITKQLDMKSLYEVVDTKKIDELELERVPIWVALEISTFHMLTLFYALLPEKYQQEIADIYELDIVSFVSWVDYLLVVRNACAHQGVLFGRRFNRKPLFEPTREATVGTAFYVLHKLLTHRGYFSMKKELEDVVLQGETSWINKYYDMLENK